MVSHWYMRGDRLPPGATATSRAGGGRLNPRDHQQDKAGARVGEAAPSCVCRIPSHMAFGQAQLVKWLVHKTRYLETESGAAQRMQHLTLCSVCSTRCGGVVVVPAGKSAAKGKQAAYGLNISSNVKGIILPSEHVN